MPRFTRLAPAAAGAAAILALTACQGGGDPATEPASADFSHENAFYDVTTETDGPVERVVADVYSAAAMWDYGVVPDGIFGYGLDMPSSLGTVDLDEIPEVVGTDGELNLEALAAVAPDLVIGVGNDTGTGWTWWDDAVTAQATEVAPFLPVKMSTGDPVRTIEEYREIARELGADADSASIEQDEADYEAALDRIAGIAAERDDLTVLLAAPTVDTVYTGAALGHAELLRSAGVQVVGPESDQAWGEVSWERLGDYPADLVLVHDVTEQSMLDAASFMRLPAVEAGQTGLFDDKQPYTYASYAAWLTEVADELEATEDIVDGPAQ